jgi:hypothetical protein
MHILISLLQTAPKQFQCSVLMVNLPIASPVDSLDYVWQYMTEGTIVSINEEFVEELRVLGEP